MGRSMLKPSGSLCSQHSALQLPGSPGAPSLGSVKVQEPPEPGAFLSGFSWSVGKLPCWSLRQGSEEDPIKQHVTVAGTVPGTQ